MDKFKNILLTCVLLIACMVTGVPLHAQDKTPITVEGCRPLLAPDCVIDDIIDEVGVLSDKHATYSNLLDADLTNGTTINTVLADIGLGYKPIVSIRDIKNVYKGGNGMKAGFMVTDSKVSLLNVDLLKTFVISLYCDNELVYTAPINDLDGNLLNLGLVNFGDKGGKTELSISVPETNDKGEEIVFDEIALGTTGVNLDVLNTLSFYYGFVGESRTEINTANFGKGLTSSAGNNLVDGNPNTDQSWGLLGGLLGEGCYIKTNEIIPQLQHKEIGFVYSAQDLLELSVLPTVTITFVKSGSGILAHDEKDSHKIEANLLGANVLGGQQIIYSATPSPGFEWDKVEISFGALNVKVGTSHLHYAFVRDIRIPEEAEKHALNLSSDALLCENETEYTLTSDVDVKWSLKQVLDLDGKTDKTSEYKSGVTIDPAATFTNSAKVTFAEPAGAGIYTFEAEDEDGCTGTVVLTRGKTREMEDASASWICGSILNKETDQVHLADPKGGALISIDNLDDAENILDGNLNTYASYAKGLQLAAHTGIVSVKKDEGTFGDDASVVGFIAETPNSLLGADVLKFYNIVLYKDGQQVYSSVVNENNTVQAALLGAPGSAKVRYAIEVPQEYVGQFDEFTLFTSGVLNLDLTGQSLKIYGAFVSDDSTCIKASDPLDHLGVTSITSQNTGATFNYSKTGNAGLVEAVTVLSNLGYLLDGTSLTADGKGAVSYSVANVLGSTDITVKTGRRFSGKRWVGFVIKVPTGIGDVDLLSGMEVKAYNEGQLVADSEKGTFLSANLIGWTDYAYVTCYTDQPFDEVTFTNKKLVEALKAIQYLGFYTYADEDGDGIPDEEDPDFCEPQISMEWGNPTVAADVNSLCVSSENEKLPVVISADNATQLYYSLINVDKMKQITSGFLDVEAAPGKFSYSIDFKALQLEAGRYKLEVSVVGQALASPASKTFIIHAAQTTWSPKGNSADWNVWENWTNGVPVIGCTDVVIPGHSIAFPVLKPYEGSDEEKPSDFNSCEGLHFEVDAEMLGAQHLNYKKAWVELELSLDRYYMLSAPLKGMYTGDFFVPKEMYGTQSNPDFTDLNETTSPAYRFGPRVYQRLWECSAPVVNPVNTNGATDAGKGNALVQVDETRWTPPFNALAQRYEKGMGFSLKAGKEDLPVTKVRFRFPKEHTQYFYYNDEGLETDLYETLDRTDNGRLFTDQITWPLVLNYTLEAESNTFLIGNPFMAHINIKKFLQENSSVTSVKVYDGNAANSQILCGGELLTNGTDEWTSIAPMQSFFVTFASPAKTAQISFTEEMLETKNGGGQPLRIAPRTDAAEEKDELVIEACADSTKAYAKVVFNDASDTAYVPGEDAALLVDNEVKPQVAVYTVADGHAADIQQTPDVNRISIGLAMSKAAPLTVRLTGRAAAQWKLYDAQTRRLYDLSVSDSVCLGRVDSNAGRFTLVKAGTEGELNLKDQGLSVCRTSSGYVAVTSANQVPLTHCSVYAADGRLISQWEGEALSVENLKAESGVNLVRAIKSDGSSCSQKVICYE